MKEVRIWLTLEKTFSVDLHKFLYKLGTGRLLRDGEMCEIMGCKLSRLIDTLKDYLSLWQDTFGAVSIQELKEKKWINRNTISVAKKIADCYEKNWIDLK